MSNPGHYDEYPELTREAEEQEFIQRVCSATGWRVSRFALVDKDNTFRVRTDDVTRIARIAKDNKNA
jgi:hypothetical protein